MSDFSKDTSARGAEEGDFLLDDEIEDLDAAWIWDDAEFNPTLPSVQALVEADIEEVKGGAAHEQAVSRSAVSSAGAEAGSHERVASRTTADSPDSGDQFDAHRRQIARLLEAGEPHQALNALLHAVSQGLSDRASLLTLSALAQAHQMELEAIEAMAIALEVTDASDVDRATLCLLLTRLLIRDRQLARAGTLIREACARSPLDDRLERRRLFISLREGDIDRVRDGLIQRIERARKTGDRRAAARFSQWLGRLFAAQGDEHFRAAECHAKAAALYQALHLPRATFLAQRDALVCLSQLDPRPRQMSGAIRALTATARTAGCPEEAAAVLQSLGLGDDRASSRATATPSVPTAATDSTAATASTDATSPDAIFQRAVDASPTLPGQTIPADEQQTKPMQRPLPKPRARSKANATEASSAVPEGATAQSPIQSPPPAAVTPVPGRFLSYFLEAEQEKLSRTEAQDRRRLERRVDECPLDANAYRALAASYDRQGRPEHARLIADVADALEARPQERGTPTSTLSDGDRCHLRHPALTTDLHEIGHLIGPALFEVSARPLDSFQPRGAFSMDGTDGAWSLADALLRTVRALGMRVDDIQLSKEGALPVYPVCSTPPALLVSKPLLKKHLSGGLLRFFAGRALATLRPELGVFLLVPRDRLEETLTGIRRAFKRQGRMSEQTRAVVQRVSGKSADRLAILLDHLPDLGGETLDLAREGARHTVNRIALFASGGIAPALEALAFENASETDRVELLRFAISKVYRELRLRHA